MLVLLYYYSMQTPIFVDFCPPSFPPLFLNFLLLDSAPIDVVIDPWQR